MTRWLPVFATSAPSTRTSLLMFSHIDAIVTGSATKIPLRQVSLETNSLRGRSSIWPFVYLCIS